MVGRLLVYWWCLFCGWVWGFCLVCWYCRYWCWMVCGGWVFSFFMFLCGWLYIRLFLILWLNLVIVLDIGMCRWLCCWLIVVLFWVFCSMDSLDWRILWFCGCCCFWWFWLYLWMVGLWSWFCWFWIGGCWLGFCVFLCWWDCWVVCSCLLCCYRWFVSWGLFCKGL